MSRTGRVHADVHDARVGAVGRDDAVELFAVRVAGTLVEKNLVSEILTNFLGQQETKHL